MNKSKSHCFTWRLCNLLLLWFLVVAVQNKFCFCFAPCKPERPLESQLIQNHHTHNELRLSSMYTSSGSDALRTRLPTGLSVTFLFLSPKSEFYKESEVSREIDSCYVVQVPKAAQQEDFSVTRHRNLHGSSLSRRKYVSFIGQATVALTGSLFAGTKPVNSVTDGVPSESSLQVVQTSSGLKYIELEPGTGISPQYGNFCSIQYKAYIKLAKTVANPNPTPVQYDSTVGYLVKHGNGRMIPGLDEGLHTMKVGGTRRLLIPPKLGYIDGGLGPIPEYPWARYKLNQLLDEMVAIGAGTLIFEVKLLSVIEDEADQGYYSDDSLTPDDFETLQFNLRQKGLQQRANSGAIVDSSTVTSTES